MSEIDTSFLDDIPNQIGGNPEPAPTPQAEPPKEDSPKADDKPTDPPVEIKPAEPAKEVTKSPAEYARERRERKAEREKRYEEFPELKKQNEEYQAKLERQAQELESLQSKVENVDGERGLETQNLESIRAENEAMKKMLEANRFQGRDSIDNDAEVQRYAEETMGALKAQLPTRMTDQYNGLIRLNSVDNIMSDPEKRQALTAAVHHYHMGTTENDPAKMDAAMHAVADLITPAGEDTTSINGEVDTALRAAMGPMTKGMERRNFVSQNQYDIVRQNHAKAATEIEERMLVPFYIKEDQARKALEENPENSWAKTALYLQSMEEGTRTELERAAASDADIMARLEYIPVPPEKADRESIERANQMTAAAHKQLEQLQRFAMVGRAVVEGGLLSRAQEAVDRLDGAGMGVNLGTGDDKGGQSEHSHLDSIPDDYRR